MSYPRKLQILIVEDEQVQIDSYEGLLAEFKDLYPHCEPVIARSVEDAKERIAEPEIYHLVLLDMNLPEERRGTVEDGVKPGEQLLDLLARRDDYPVPVVLIVTGKLHWVDPVTLMDRLTKDFWHGQLVNKGMNQSRAIETGLQKAIAYCDVGIHLRDGGPTWYPTVSPREIDLLRRCVLTQDQCLGVDLEWWGAEEGASTSRPNPNVGPTKVLMGRFLLDRSPEPVLQSFFKFEPSGNAPHVSRDVGVLSKKLPHITRTFQLTSHQRSLLVTRSVTGQRPVSLKAYLRGNPAEVLPRLPDLVSDIVGQIDLLSRPTEQQVPVSTGLLTAWVDRGDIGRFWAGGNDGVAQTRGTATPVTLLDQLRDNSSLVWVQRRSCTHGDLNATNVAVDPDAKDRPHAYIFDAAGIEADIDLRDLAVLEVSTVLFNAEPGDRSLLQACRDYYRDGLAEGGVCAPLGSPPLVQNILGLLRAVRSHVARTGFGEVYAVLVFDAVVRQLFGLAVAPKRNKIADPGHARTLASWVVGWVPKAAPTLLPPRPPHQGTGGREGQPSADEPGSDPARPGGDATSPHTGEVPSPV